MRLVDCSQQGCSLEAAIVEDCLVDGFDTSGQLLQIWGAVFNRVVLCGKIGRLMISWVVDMVNRRSEVQRAFDTANSDYYRGVDWALDISRGEFKELDIRGISASLIRRDPETQVVVTREKAIQGAWRELEFKVAPWRASLGLLLECEQSDIVLVVPKQHRRFREYLADLQLLRKAGVAEPD
ncbi:MAG: hypothetical protein NT031_01040 [Planctomycetota bacterium]|nr:hypothetical protein [Planctomycetota bacterium]